MLTFTQIFRPKRIMLALGGVAAFLLVFVIATRITVSEIFRGIEATKATGLASVAPWDSENTWSTRSQVSYDILPTLTDQRWVSRKADLRMRSRFFDRSVASLRQIASSHRGYFEGFRTDSRSGRGRSLEAMLSVPSSDFEATLSDLQSLGRTEAVSESGEDSAIKIATAARRLDATRTNLSRLQKLQQERRGALRDAVELEKEIGQARATVAEAEREHTALVSTTALASFQVTIIEDYKAPLRANLAGALLMLRNSFVDGIAGTLSSVSSALGALLQFGLPLVFWLALLFWPVRIAWQRFRAKTADVPVSN